MAKVPAKEPSLNDALQGDLFANALTGTPTKDLKDILSDGDNARANTKLKTKAKAKAKAKASAKAKSTASAPVHSQSQDKSPATGNSHNKAQAKIEAKAETKADSKAKNNADAKGESKGKAKADSKAKAKTKSKNKADAKGEAKAKAKLKAKHQGQSLTSGKDNSKSNEVLLDPSLELILDAADGSNADTQVISTATATASALTKVKANKHAHKANKSQDKDLVLDANELSNRANMGLLTDTEQTLLSPLFSDVLSEQNILEESKESLLTPHMSSLLEGQELEEQALESELKILSCTEVNSAASESAISSTSDSASASANTSDSDSTSASSSESAQSQSDASNSDTSHSDTKGKSNESVKQEFGLGALGSLGALGANLSDSGEFELKVQTLQELEALDKASGQDKADTEDNNAKQGSLFLEGYVVGQGGLFDDVNDEVVNNNDDIELVYVPLKEVSLQEKFSDVLAPSENLPELGEDESDSDVDIYAPQEPAFNFFEPSPDSLQASQFPSLGAEASIHTSAGGSASASTGANAEVKAMGEGKAVMVNHEVESDSTMATESQDDTKVKATATRKARAGAKASANAGSKSRVKADSKDGTGASAGVDLVAHVGADAGAEAEAGAGAGAKTSAKAKAKAKAKVVYEPYEYPIDPKVYAVCGIDEAGRGPLMGDVVAACVILDHNHMIEGLNDSKKLTEKARDALAPIIKEQAIAYGIGRASPQEIDSLNILNATFLAMRRAFDAMQKSCNLALIDGNKIPKTFSDIPMVMEAVVKGDARVAEISAASILAKTTRDADCYELDKLYPEYGFARHKGYPTKDHLEALANLPILPCYRKSYGPVKKLLAGSQDDIETISPNVQKRLETAKDTKQKKLDELLIENTLISLDDFA